MTKIFSAKAIARTAGDETFAIAVLEGPVLRKKAKDSEEHCDPGQRKGQVEAGCENRTGEDHSPSGNEEIGARNLRPQAIGKPSAEKSRASPATTKSPPKALFATRRRLAAAETKISAIQKPIPRWQSHRRLRKSIEGERRNAKNREVIAEYGFYSQTSRRSADRSGSARKNRRSPG